MFIKNKEILICLFIFIGTFSVYGQVTNFDFLNYDDSQYVTHNPYVKAGLTLNGLKWAFTDTSTTGNWHPLTWISHMLDCQLFGTDAGKHHLISVLFHIANSLLLFIVLRMMTGKLWQSGFVAALFALHPLHVESVAWVSERKDVLSTFSGLLAMGCYLWYVNHPEIKRYALTLFLFILGLMAKIMPAYNAAKTLRATFDEVINQNVVDLVIIVDDGSRDETVYIAQSLPHTLVFTHDKNCGYGANQKSCYKLALEQGGDIIVMVHPDYQYTPQLIPAMVSMIGNGLYHCVMGSRILGGYALKGGMPLWKYSANRFLTLIENILVGAKLSEYHSGYRAFSRRLLEQIPFQINSDDFVFDNQMLAQIIWFGYTVAEISCPTKYFPDASSINLLRSIKYGFGCLLTAFTFRLAKMKFVLSRLFPDLS